MHLLFHFSTVEITWCSHFISLGVIKRFRCTHFTPKVNAHLIHFPHYSSRQNNTRPGCNKDFDLVASVPSLAGLYKKQKVLMIYDFEEPQLEEYQEAVHKLANCGTLFSASDSKFKSTVQRENVRWVQNTKPLLTKDNADNVLHNISEMRRRALGEMRLQEASRD